MFSERQFDEFMTVSAVGNITKAAKLLYMTQPALSQQIAAYEKTVGFTLFNRSQGGVTLTAAGKSFYQDMKEIGVLYDQAIEKGRSISISDAHMIRIGIISSGNGFIYRRAAVGFLHDYPYVKIAYVASPYLQRARENALIEGKYDLVYGEYYQSIEQRGLKFYDLLEDTNCLLMSKNHDLATRTVLHPEDLDGQTIVILDNGPESASDCVRRVIECETWHATIEVDDLDETIILRVQQGEILLLNSMMNGDDSHADIVRIPFECGVRIRMGFMYKAEPNGLLLEFMDYVKSGIGLYVLDSCAYKICRDARDAIDAERTSDPC